MDFEKLTQDIFKDMDMKAMAHDAIAKARKEYEPLHGYYAKHDGKEPRDIIEAAIQMQEFQNASRACGFED